MVLASMDLPTPAAYVVYQLSVARLVSDTVSGLLPARLLRSQVIWSRSSVQCFISLFPPMTRTNRQYSAVYCYTLPSLSRVISVALLVPKSKVLVDFFYSSS